MQTTVLLRIDRGSCMSLRRLLAEATTFLLLSRLATKQLPATACHAGSYADSHLSACYDMMAITVVTPRCQELGQLSATLLEGNLDGPGGSTFQVAPCSCNLLVTACRLLKVVRRVTKAGVACQVWRRRGVVVVVFCEVMSPAWHG